VKHSPEAVYSMNEKEYFAVNEKDATLIKLDNIRNRRMQTKGRDGIFMFDADWSITGQINPEESIRRSDGSMFHISVDNKK